MLRLQNHQPSLWEAVLPPAVLRLNEELTTIDRLLDDERFLAPFLQRFNTRIGRPTVPVATYLRMMYLKRRYQLGYETLVKEATDSFSWRRFCHLSIDDPVPESTTLIKLTHKYGEAMLRDLNDTLLRKLKEGKVIKGKKLRVDTAVTEANIHYPTDTGLLADGIRVITRTVGKLKKSGVEIGMRFVNHMRTVKKTWLGLMKVMKKRVRKDHPDMIAARETLSRLAEEVVAAGREIDSHVSAPADVPPGIQRLARQLGDWVAVTGQIIEQTRKVIDGCRHIPRRIVSLFDRDARPIRRGKLRVDTEFGHKVLIGETDHGIITTYEVVQENPADTTLLKPAVQGHKRIFRRKLKAVATDRGFSSRDNEAWLHTHGITQASIPARGKVTKQRRCHQRQAWFKRLQRFRAGVEARISLLHRKFGLKRSLMRGTQGTAIWVGQGIFTHNLWQAARIV